MVAPKNLRMPVDIFGRTDVRVISGEATLNQSGADKVSKSGDTMTGDLLLSIGTDTIRQLGCTDITTGKGFSLVLGNVRNQLQFAVIPAEQTQTPVTLETTHGFLVRAAGHNVCWLGNADNPSSINIYTNVFMNRSTTIKNLVDPTDPGDAATKNYVDLAAAQQQGYIPPLGENNSKTGFVVTASSFLSQQHAPYMAFNPLLTGDINVEWATAGQGAGAWLQIQCPAAVRIWKIQLAGRRSNTERITSWNLAGSTGAAFTTVLSSTTTLGSTVQEFLVNIAAGTSYSIYRLNVVAAEPTNTGLSVFQIFPSIN